MEALYHNYLTGLILTTVSRRSGADAAELIFRTFRRQHLEKFLPGLAKLGLSALPHAVACAQYHYLSNHVGGVRVEYMYESDRKAWVRYVPPRWIYDGATICGVPTEVSSAMLRGWHAHNGVSLGNARLGFVCTKQTTDGQPGLEGYYLEYDRDLAPEERLRFAPNEDGPDFDPARAPRLEGADWPQERLRKITRNYSMDYVRTILPVLAETFGDEEATRLGGVTGLSSACSTTLRQRDCSASLATGRRTSPNTWSGWAWRKMTASSGRARTPRSWCASTPGASCRASPRRRRRCSSPGTRSGRVRSPCTIAGWPSTCASASTRATPASNGVSVRSPRVSEVANCDLKLEVTICDLKIRTP